MTINVDSATVASTVYARHTTDQTVAPVWTVVQPIACAITFVVTIPPELGSTPLPAN